MDLAISKLGSIQPLGTCTTYTFRCVDNVRSILRKYIRSNHFRMHYVYYFYYATDMMTKINLVHIVSNLKAFGFAP